MNSQVLWEAFPETVLSAYGAKLNYLINAPHYQWWRFITPMFVHINLPHLLVNMYSLWMVGPYVEKLYGSAKFVVFWVATGIMGVVASYLTVRPNIGDGPLARFLFRSADLPSAGASGALFGLVGVLFVFGIKFRHELPEGFKRAFGTGMLPIIFINLFIGYVGRGFIDNAAHLGGLVTGALLALAVEYRRPGERTSVAVAWRVLQATALVIVVAGFYKVVRNFNRPIPPSVQQLASARRQIFLNFIGSMNLLLDQASRVVHNNDSSGVEETMQRAMETAVPDSRAAELRDQLLGILAKLTAATNNPQQREQIVNSELKTWQDEYYKWFEGAAQNGN